MQTTSLFGTSMNYNNSLVAACPNIRNPKQRHSIYLPSKIPTMKLPIYPRLLHHSTDRLPLRNTNGPCRASQVAELFSSTSPDIVVVREARTEDCWEVAETHCSTFFPGYSFPLGLLLRINRLIGTLFRFSNPTEGCKRALLVAVIGGPREEDDDGSMFGGFYDSDQNFDVAEIPNKFSPLLNKGFVAGILTVDTMADFLPRKGPQRQRRTGIAYISNVAVRDEYRRKGIAKKLVAEAEAKAKSWGCRAMALHCDLKNPGAIHLYSGQGFKSIKVPESANWPRPRASRDVRYSFMMKLVPR